MKNLVILAGNVGNAPETRTTQGGTKITSFSLATSRLAIWNGQSIVGI